MLRPLRFHPLPAFFVPALVAATAFASGCDPGEAPPPGAVGDGSPDPSEEMVPVDPSPTAAVRTAAPLSAGPAALLAEVTGWRGELPCADCAGILTTLVLDPDGSYALDEAYLGLSAERIADGDTLMGTRGRWTASLDGGRIRLTGEDQGPRYLRLTGEGTLRQLDREGGEIESEHNHELSRLPDIPDLLGRLRFLGAFRYMADAALVVPCAGGLQFPVAMEGAYLELERDYGAQATAPGAPWLVHLRGAVAERPAMEGPGTEAAFVVQSHEAARPGTPCAALAVSEALAEGEWEVTALDGAALPELPTPGTPPTLAWDADAHRVHGTGGCNRFAGRGFLRGTALFAQEVAATRRFCDGTMEVEDRYFRILSDGGHLMREEEELVLFRGPVEVARFRRP